MDIVIEQLTHQRLELDKIFKTLEEDGEHFMVQHSVKLAFMWLGKAKGIAGSANPYPESTDASSKKIEAAVDQYEGDLFDNEDEIAFIKTLRKELDTIEGAVRNGLMPYLAGNRFFQQALLNSYSHICEAKMFLGLALGEIRERLTPSEEPPVGEPLPPSDLGASDANTSLDTKTGTPESTTPVHSIPEVPASVENAPLEAEEGTTAMDQAAKEVALPEEPTPFPGNSETSEAPKE